MYIKICTVSETVISVEFTLIRNYVKIKDTKSFSVVFLRQSCWKFFKYCMKTYMNFFLQYEFLSISFFLISFYSMCPGKRLSPHPLIQLQQRSISDVQQLKFWKVMHATNGSLLVWLRCLVKLLQHINNIIPYFSKQLLTRTIDKELDIITPITFCNLFVSLD